jgi:integrase
MPTEEDVQRLLQAILEYYDPAKNFRAAKGHSASNRAFHRERTYTVELTKLDSACRIGEIFNLKCSDYAPSAQQLTIRTSKGREPRTLPVSDTLQQQIRQSEELWGVSGCDLPVLALETQPGDLLCFNHNLKHAAFGGGTRRRMFTIDVSQRYPADRLDSLRSYIGTYARFCLERYYGEAMVRTASPERMRHLEQALANDGHLAALSQQERLVRPEPSRG